MKYGNMTWGRMEAVINMLGGEEGAERLLRGEMEVVVKAIKKLVGSIDCSTQPSIPEGWSIHEEDQIKSAFKGQLQLNDLSKLVLFLSEQQKNGGGVNGNILCKELEGQIVLPANVLDYWLENKHLIPDVWKGKYVFFFGTIYRGSRGDLCVRYLYWGSKSWFWSNSWLSGAWDSYNPTVVLSQVSA